MTRQLMNSVIWAQAQEPQGRHSKAEQLCKGHSDEALLEGLRRLVQTAGGSLADGWTAERRTRQSGVFKGATPFSPQRLRAPPFRDSSCRDMAKCADLTQSSRTCKGQRHEPGHGQCHCALRACPFWRPWA